MERYPGFLGDIDDLALYQTDEFERFKKYKASKKNVVGSTPAIMREDNDEKFEFYDIQGESVYSQPPDPNTPVIVHGLDEDSIWNFPKTVYNQSVVKNPYLSPFSESFTQSHAPRWGKKLSQPHFFKPEKLEKFKRHWGHRLGLEALKMKHVSETGPSPTPAQKEVQDAEINAYIQSCYDFEAGKLLEDVYVTDHQPEAKKYLTGSEEEDQDFYEYEQSVAEYNQGGAGKKLQGAGRTKYERGSLLQKIHDPFAGAPRDEDGAIVYEVTDAELSE
jgi:hypothetical protein